MEEELKQLKELNEGLQQKLASAEEMYDTAVENHSKVTAESNEKVLTYKTKKNYITLFSHTPSFMQCSDLEQRLKMLQIDYAAIQASHDKLEEEKLVGGREMQAMKEDLKTLKDKLKKAEEEIMNLHKDKESVSEELKQLKSSVKHQLVNREQLNEVSYD